MCWATHLDAPHPPWHGQFKCRVLVVIWGHDVHKPMNLLAEKKVVMTL